jgi:DNA-directed RNA polymerase specialized sigma24 family protein
MSPEKKRDFESEWPLLAKRLKSFLARKNVPVTKQDDLIQDTALRLYKMWDTVDRNRPAWALTVTIALNLLRDEYRRAPHADVVSELPDIPQNYDVERAGLARVEIGRVRQALAEMSPAHRLVLLAEVGHPSGVTDAGEKMRRMRARRKLTEILERVSAIFVLPARRLADVAHAMIGARDGLFAGVSCVLCTVLGIGVAVTAPLGVGSAGASTLRSDGTGDRAAIVATAIMASDVSTASGLVADAPDAGQTVGSSSTGVRASGGDADASGEAPLPELPSLPSDPAPEPPTVPLPNRGPQGGPSVPTVPEPPPVPSLPGQRDPNGGVQEELERLLRRI